MRQQPCDDEHNDAHPVSGNEAVALSFRHLSTSIPPTPPVMGRGLARTLVWNDHERHPLIFAALSARHGFQVNVSRGNE